MSRIVVLFTQLVVKDVTFLEDIMNTSENTIEQGEFELEDILVQFVDQVVGP